MGIGSVFAYIHILDGKRGGFPCDFGVKSFIEEFGDESGQLLFPDISIAKMFLLMSHTVHG